MPIPVSNIYKVAKRSHTFRVQSIAIILFLLIDTRLVHISNIHNKTIQPIDFSKKVCYVDEKYQNMSLTFTQANNVRNHEQAKVFFKMSWSPKFLHKELYPIAFLESNFNKNIDHEKSIRGDFFTAFGPLGLKPITAWEQFKKTPYIKKQYAHIDTQQEFENLFYNSIGFYNKIASAHWRSLRLRYPTVFYAAYAWRWGPGAADKIQEEELWQDEYVNRYKEKSTLANNSKTKDINFISLESAEAARDIREALSKKSFTAAGVGEGHDNKYYIYGERSWFLKKSEVQPQPFSGYQQFDHSTSRREYAFYSVAKVLGLDHFIPETHLITIGDQEWIATELMPKEYNNFREGVFSQEVIKNSLTQKNVHGDLHRWAILDFIAGNPDRHAGNLLMNNTTGDIKLIDHGSSMCGKDFSPNNDYYSFVAYYLRFTTSGGYYYFSKNPLINKMPQVPEDTDRELARWAMSIDTNALSDLLTDHGFDPETFVNRLELVQNLENNLNFSNYINKLWFFV